MKTNYTKIDAAIKRLETARDELNRVARQRIGVISGGPSIDDENAEFEAALEEAVTLTQAAIKSGCRLSTLREHLCGEMATTRIIDAEIQEREYVRNYAKYN